MKKYTKENIKRWIISTIITFLAGLGIYLMANIDSITLETLKDGSLWAFIFAGIRAGIKAVIEGFLIWKDK